jgi:hypothetical protein
MEFKRETIENRVAEREEDVDRLLPTEQGKPLAEAKGKAHERDQMSKPSLRHRPPRMS